MTLEDKCKLALGPLFGGAFQLPDGEIQIRLRERRERRVDNDVELQFHHLEALTQAFKTRLVDVVLRPSTPDYSEYTPGDPEELYIRIRGAS